MRRFKCCCVLLLLGFLYLSVLNTYGKANEICISKGGRFPPFSSEGKPPKKANKGQRDLVACRIFRKRTCCDVAQTHPLFLTISRLASFGEANQECVQLWELLECSICDPLVGVQVGPPLICASFCNRVYEACFIAYFSMDTKKQGLAPCAPGDFVCGRASEWVSNGTELCHAAGFAVTSIDDPQDISCYGGKPSLDYIANSWKKPESERLPVELSTHALRNFKQWIGDMPFIERVSWAIGGMVLTAGLIFASKRKTYSQRRKKAVQDTVRKLGSKESSSAPAHQGRQRRIGRRLGSSM